MRALILSATALLLLAPALPAQLAGDTGYLRWSAQQAESIGQSTYNDGRIGTRWLDTRGLKTDRAQNYKLRATWFTPEVLRAAARFAQIKERLTDQQTRQMVTEAEALGGTVVLVEIDPNEGSGVIPLDWSAFLQPRGNEGAAVRGEQKPELRASLLFKGVRKRNYDYEQFWVLFPLRHEDGSPLAGAGVSELELVVRIQGREGTVSWTVPASVRALLSDVGSL